jgi:hypothetical protein
MILEGKNEILFPEFHNDLPFPSVNWYFRRCHQQSSPAYRGFKRLLSELWKTDTTYPVWRYKEQREVDREDRHVHFELGLQFYAFLKEYHK